MPHYGRKIASTVFQALPVASRRDAQPFAGGPDKTRLIEFGRYAAERRRKRGQGGRKRSTFWLHALLRNGPLRKVPGRTIDAKKRMQATLTEIRDNLYQRWHEPVPVFGKWLQRVLNG